MRLSLLVFAPLAAALALVPAASAAAPRLALFDVHRNLAPAAHNEFGDVKVWKRPAALAKRSRGAELAHCGADCSFGAGWVAFSGKPGVSGADVVSAKARRTNGSWTLVLGLTGRGTAGLKQFQRLAALSGRTRGVPDALAFVLNGTIIAQPLASQIHRGRGSIEIPGFSRAGALRAARLFAG